MGTQTVAQFPHIAPFPRPPFNLLDIGVEKDLARQLDRMERLARLIELAFKGWNAEEGSDPTEEDFALFEELLGALSCEAWQTRTLYAALVDPKSAPPMASS